MIAYANRNRVMFSHADCLKGHVTSLFLCALESSFVCFLKAQVNSVDWLVDPLACWNIDGIACC